MLESLELGLVPSDEPCPQVGAEEYLAEAQRCGRAWKEQLIRVWSDTHPGTEVPILRVRSFSHDFGAYHEVVVEYASDASDAVAAAFWLESHLPSTWDEMARVLVLGLKTAR